MALAREERVIVDAAGNVQPGASVEVRREIPGQPLEPLFSNRAGTVPLGNPVIADANGKVAFHCLGGAFQITATKGTFSDVRRYVGIGLAKEVDVLGNTVVQQLRVSGAGTFAERTGFDGEDTGFVYLSTDGDGASITDPVLFFKKSPTPADWADAVLFSNTQFLPNGPGVSPRPIQDRLRETVSVFDFGAVGNGIADDWAAIQAALDYAQSLSTAAVDGPAGRVIAPAGYRYRISQPLTMSRAIHFWCGSFIEYVPTTDSAFIIGAQAPLSGGADNRGYDIYIMGLRALNGLIAPPTTINAAGCSGMECRSMHFSRVQVDKIIAFDKYGFWGNCSLNNYPKSHCQDNDVYLGEIALNGAGIVTHSESGVDASWQVNRMQIRNCYSNFQNFFCGTDVPGNIDNSNNQFYFDALDAAAPGGSAVTIFGGFNRIICGVLNGHVEFDATSRNNMVLVHSAGNQTFADNGFGNVWESFESSHGLSRSSWNSGAVRSLELQNGANHDVVPPNASMVIINGPTQAFSITGIQRGVPGRELHIYNATGQAMTLSNESVNSDPENRINAPSGAALTSTGNATAILKYSQSRWIVMSWNP